jgi:hypothetical protein
MRRGGILILALRAGLRRVALAAGAVLHEHTPVLHLEDGDPLILTMPGGRLRAREVILATNAYTPDLGWLGSRVLRLYVYLFATAPLTAAQREKVGWGGREGIYTAHEMLESYRVTSDQRIVGGAKLVRYGYGGRPLFDDPATFVAIEDAFRLRFPELADVRITHRWGGPIGFALDFLPAVGSAGRHGNVYYSIGYAGHGIALASYAGTMLTDMIAGRDGPGEALWGRRQVPLPPEPAALARGAPEALTGVFSAIDQRVDDASRRPAAPRSACLSRPRDLRRDPRTSSLAVAAPLLVLGTRAERAPGALRQGQADDVPAAGGGAELERPHPEPGFRAAVRAACPVARGAAVRAPPDGPGAPRVRPRRVGRGGGSGAAVRVRARARRAPPGVRPAGASARKYRHDGDELASSGASPPRSRSETRLVVYRATTR